MHIVILANQDIASCLAINYLLQGLPADHFSLILSRQVGSSPAQRELQLLKFVEQSLFNRLLFPTLGKYTGQAGQLLGFDQIRRELEGRVFEPYSINESTGLMQLAATEPDLILSIRFGQILREPAIAIPTRGVLNLHSGILPYYRGVMATFWALLHGEKLIGTTLHYIDDPCIDTGPIISKTSLAVDQDRSYLWHVLALYEAGCRSMVDAAENIRIHGSAESHTQPAGGSYFSFPDQEQLDRFKRQGWRLFDPEDLTEVVRRFLP